MENKIPRGIRNNNPLNIRVGNMWMGEVAEPTDKEFEQFIDIFYGLRAGFIILKRYIERYHLCTIRKIVSRWAPPAENNTKAYVAMVVAKTGIPADQEINFADSSKMVAIVEAMCRIECGKNVPLNSIWLAYQAVNV